MPTPYEAPRSRAVATPPQLAAASAATPSNPGDDSLEARVVDMLSARGTRPQTGKGTMNDVVESLACHDPRKAYPRYMQRYRPRAC